jgi:glycosyltransferase involved in cell wall biosynthesis
MDNNQQLGTRLLRILVIADSKISVPPKGYGGAERVLAHLCEGFARRGHEVTLMAAEGSRNYGRLITYPWAGQHTAAWRAYCKLNFLLRSVRELIARHDVIIAGCRTSYLSPFLFAGVPLLYRFGNPIDPNDVGRLINTAKGPLSLVAVSNHQRTEFPSGPWHTIYNGADVRRIACSNHPTGSYLAFIGRLTANKGADIAIRIAKRTGLSLKIAGNVSDEPGGRTFFEREIRPQLGGNIEWIGEIGDDRKFEFLAAADALLAPVQWDEPCANVVMEALACGTPVIATRRGCMPELIRNGVTGFLACNEDEVAHAVARISEISRQLCRKDAEKRFSIDEMVEEYLDVARGLIARRYQTFRPCARRTSTTRLASTQTNGHQHRHSLADVPPTHHNE